MDDLQKRTAQAIVNIFETGRILGEYGQVTLIAGDAGQLTYGRSQTTLTSGNLYLLISAYCATPNCQFGSQLAPFLPALQRRDSTLNHDSNLKAVLREAGADPAMHQCQDAFFDRVYWQPAKINAQAIGASSALGGAAVYDSVVHGSWGSIRDRTIARFGRLADIGERIWIQNYLTVRREWLASFTNSPLRLTVYRMDSLLGLVSAGSWDLPLPLKIRGLTITQDILTDQLPVRASAQIGEQRQLRLSTPYMQGSDVKAVQDALRRGGASIEADGMFGPATDAAVKAYQTSHNMVADGIVGPATAAMLGLL